MTAKQPSNKPDAQFTPASFGDSPDELRGALRGPLRDAPEDSRDRARKRMAELRDLHGESVLDDGIDNFAIDTSIIPEGWDYEWRRHTVLNKPDPTYTTSLARAGWEPVPTRRHPQLMPHGTPGDSPILRDGNILMERPMELTLSSKQAALRTARNQVRIKEDQLSQAPGPGHFERNNKGQSMASVSKSYVPLVVPES